MKNSKLHLRWVALVLIAGFLAGCSAPTPSPMPPPPLQPNTPLPPPPQPNTPLPPPIPGPTIQPTTQNAAFKFVRTVKITPDENFDNGGLGYIHYIPATDRFVVILGPNISKPYPLTYSSEKCMGKGVLYKEYTTDMQPTGRFGFLSCLAADFTSFMLGNNLYLVGMAAGPQWIGWRLEEFDATTWQRKAHVDIPLDQGNAYEADNGPTISYVNGLIDAVGQFFYRDQVQDSPAGGSHHHFFTPDLKPAGTTILKPPEIPIHVPMGSMLQESNGDILMFEATKILSGDLIVLRFDKNWHYLSEEKIRDRAFLPTGSLSIGGRYYVAFMDNSLYDVKSQDHPVFNVHLAAYGSDWNTVQDEAVTTLTSADHQWSESAWLMQHGNYLYLSYMVNSFDPETKKDLPGQAYVNIYEIPSTP